MIDLRKTGYIFYGTSIMVYGILQIATRDFRMEILPGFPAWVHEHTFFAIVTGIVMVIAGLIINGLLNTTCVTRGKTALGTGLYFVFLILFSHIPYLLFVYPHKLSHLGSWGDALKELAFAGGAFIMAASFFQQATKGRERFPSIPIRYKLLTTGRILFCTTIFLYGCNHFAYDISAMVPHWFGFPNFWSYLGGIALICSGITIMFKVYFKTIALLLAIMLFLWFLLLHIPNAVASPFARNGSPIANAFDALLFCGTALVLSATGKRTSLKYTSRNM